MIFSTVTYLVGILMVWLGGGKCMRGSKLLDERSSVARSEGHSSLSSEWSSWSVSQWEKGFMVAFYGAVLALVSLRDVITRLGGER